MASQNNPKVEELINLDDQGTIWFDNENSQIKKLNKNGSWEILFDPNKTSTKILYDKDKNLVQYWDSSVDNWVTLFNPENKPTKKDIQTHYRRNFRSARGSEQFLNDELHQIHTALKNINYRKNENKGEEPYSVLDGALWFDKVDNQLKYWDEPSKTWKCIFSKKFQITDQITNITTPASPLPGQLWIYNGVLMYFDGTQNKWLPIKAMIQDETQWSNAAFEDYIIVTPLATANTVSSAISSGSDKHALEETVRIDTRKPAGEKFTTKVYYEIGNGELEVFLNGHKMTNGLRFTEATRRGFPATEKDYGNISNIFIMNVDLEPGDIVSYILSRNSTANSALETALMQTNLNDYNDNHINTNFIDPSEKEWTSSNGVGTSMEWPQYFAEDIDEDLVSQFVIPNINTDRVFIDHDYNEDYDKVNKVCVEYKTKDIYRKTMSAIHLNPGKLTKITKKLIKIDRQNPTIDINAYNTEFYGFKVGQLGGDFLIPSSNQDNCDYVTAGDKIILNQHTKENYDYLLAITFEFTWIKSDGVMEHHSGKFESTSYYVTNIQTPIFVHYDGLMLEEASYNVDADSDIITIKENTDKIDIDIWSPSHKEYGYIRDVDIEGNGIIHLHHKPSCPLVFVGGILMDPFIMSKNIDLELGIVKIPNELPYVDNMKNQPWCVVDIQDMTGNDGIPFTGLSLESEEQSIVFNQDYPELIGNDAILAGSLIKSNESNVWDFILARGTFKTTGFVDIIYDPSQISEEDGILLFVNGLLVCPDDIDRDDDNGIINIYNLEPDSDYVLLRDPDGRVYRHSNIMQAYSIGYISDSLVYLNGKLLANENCVATTETPDKIDFDNMIHNEIKFFIEDEENNLGTWKIYDAYNYKWINLTDYEEIRIVNDEVIKKTYAEADWIKEVTEICSSYINLLTSIKINLTVEQYDHNIDDLAIYAFKFANTNSGIYKNGNLIWFEDDEEDGLPIYMLDGDVYSRGMNNLNLYKNGIKLINGIHYKELDIPNKIKMLIDIGVDDIMKYIIEPIEKGETKAYEQIILENINSIQPNVYEIQKDDSEDDGKSFYPGRLTVYVNGLRLPNEDWTVIDNKRIMLNYRDYKTAASVSKNYPKETYIKDSASLFEIEHKYPDYILVEVRKDFDRKEYTLNYSSKDNNQLYIEKKHIPEEILDCKDEVLFFLNGQYLGMSRRTDRDYNINKYKSCIEILNTGVLNALINDPMRVILQDPVILNAWRKYQNDSTKDYEKEENNKITLVWR